MQNALYDLSGGATLSNYTPSLRENLVNLLARNWYGDTREGTRKAEKLMGVADMTPVGLATGLYDAGRDLGQGNYAMAGVGAGLAALPLPGAVKDKAKKTIRAYHGSPHDFDKFSMDKIGTGEGAQAYGHGLYFADSEGTAKFYRDQLASGKDITVGGKPLHWVDRSVLSDYPGLIEGKISIDDAIARARDMRRDTHVELLQDIKAKGGIQKSGKMYEVEINADPDQFLDWDKPLSEQPEHIRNAMVTPDAMNLQQRLKQVVEQKDALASVRHPVTNAIADEKGWHQLARESETLQDQLGRAVTPDLPGQLAYYRLNNKKLNAPEGSHKLREQGIPGIKYLDQGSRGKGDGTRNYVVFDENLINIVRKYGITGALLAGAISQQDAEHLREQGY